MKKFLLASSAAASLLAVATIGAPSYAGPAGSNGAAIVSAPNAIEIRDEHWRHHGWRRHEWRRAHWHHHDHGRHYGWRHHREHDHRG